uniref:HECT domain-containing protein n=1 Tax=Knipowitschia caucasica TaxID=637954 RepID=A0AAV2KJ29_KNICA
MMTHSQLSEMLWKAYPKLELDTVDMAPLPPDAPEFKLMPKAPCATCNMLVPLQSLPLHELLSECPMPAMSPEKKKDKTECPVCKTMFCTDLIEVHAAECGLRSEVQNNTEDIGFVSSKDVSDFEVHSIDSFQSLDQILSWISSQVQDGTFEICVSRSDIFNRGMHQWQRQKMSSPKFKLMVSFIEENGFDTGALGKEFLTEMIAEIEKRLFVGGVDKKGKNPVYCLGSLDKNYFRAAGEIMAASIAQGGPLPSFMRKWCYAYICSGDADDIQVTSDDVTDVELSQLITKIQEASNETIGELIDGLMNCGYTGIISDNKKDVMTRSVVLHSTMRLIPMLDQLRKGLQLYGLLRVLHIMLTLLPLFVSGEDDGVDAAFIIQKCHPEYSEKGSVRYTREVNIMNFFQDFLQDIEDQDDLEAEVEDGHKKLTVGRVMQWITGQGHKPCLPSEKADFKYLSDSTMIATPSILFAFQLLVHVVVPLHFLWCT